MPTPFLCGFFPFLFFPSPREGTIILFSTSSSRCAHPTSAWASCARAMTGRDPCPLQVGARKVAARGTGAGPAPRRACFAAPHAHCPPGTGCALAGPARPHKHPRASPRACGSQTAGRVSGHLLLVSFRSVGQLHLDAGQRRRARLTKARRGPCSSVSARTRLSGMTVSACTCSLTPCLLPVQQPNGQQSP